MGFKKVVFLAATLIVLHGAQNVQGAGPIELDGFIEPYEVANVGTGVSGVIDSIEVDRGDIVKKGKILARLDTRVEQSTVNLIKARAEMGRQFLQQTPCRAQSRHWMHTTAVLCRGRRRSRAGIAQRVSPGGK